MYKQLFSWSLAVFIFFFSLIIIKTYHNSNILPFQLIPFQRAVFHEITKDAILRAFETPRDLDMNLVHSQETRRILDRLAGFTVSPMLWR